MGKDEERGMNLKLWFTQRKNPKSIVCNFVCLVWNSVFGNDLANKIDQV